MISIHTVPPFDITNPAEAVEALPYLLGHQPDGPGGEVFIVVCDTDERRALFSRRATVPLAGADPNTAAGDLIHFALSKLEEMGGGPAGVVIFVFPSQAGPDDRTSALGRHSAFAKTLGRCAEQHGLAVLANLCVTPTHWWFYGHSDAPTLPAGTPVHGPQNPGPITMDAIAKGLPTPPSAAEIIAAITPASGADADKCKAALLKAAQSRAAREAAHGKAVEEARFRATLDRLLRDGGDGTPLSDLKPVECAELILGLRDRHTRDVAAEYIEPTELARARELWSLLARRCVSDRTALAAAPLTLAGITAAASGDLMAARIALQRARAVDRAYVLADLLLQMLAQDGSISGFLEIVRAERAERRPRA
ncbi:DUF4192 domain-containing protein [Kitasatospora griseola]